MQSVDPQNGKNFWKKNNKSVPGSIRAVYGAMHPPIIHSPRSSPRKEISQKKVMTSSSFQDYQESVNDAWDCGDDEFCMISDVKISSRVVQSTAQSVINSHRIGQLPVTANSPMTSAAPGTALLAETDSTLVPTGLETSASGNPPANQQIHPDALSAPQGLENLQQTLSKQNVHSASTSPIPHITRADDVLQQRSSFPVEGCERKAAKLEKFEELINGNTDLTELRKLAWSGVLPAARPVAWRLLNGYLPANMERREDTLKRKREEYWSFVQQYYDTRHDDIHLDTYRQIHIDIPRMSPLVPLFQQRIVQEMFERILYIWAIRHPASGYVQGINDLVTPFFIVFLHEVVPEGECVDTYDLSQISEEKRAVVEADSFWCMSKLLDGIQDNYTFAQPGIQTKVLQLKELMQRIDSTLHEHLERHEIDYLQFSFRWFNNLLMRELPLACTVRLWDTLQAEPDGFSHFLLYVCAAFLKHFSQQLLAQRDFQSLMLLVQNLPTASWSDSEVSLLVAEAFRLKYVFADAPNHLQANKK
ncbi:TBC1 domain family member 22 isoform X1 [Oratosquilla oratoria]|uniref:TBC1 domain family member 22 isoform X1 n=1 Tax=Oratosquilla oratoria TaxID=337810 RepID=UPI003F7704C3